MVLVQKHDIVLVLKQDNAQSPEHAPFLKTPLSGAGSTGARTVRFEDLITDIVLEVQNETCG